ncbi:MAG TPA: cyclic nucleotide-binding domain-containing protein [Geobacter sp.]|nr:cyclic nucleotide-binding domain-containing protein [Geobacter sp.]
METTRPVFLKGFVKVPITPELRGGMLAENDWAKNLGVDQAELLLLAHYMYPYRGEKGATVFREGDSESFMCLICEGQLQIARSDCSTSLSVVGPGNTVGEMALIDGHPRSASALALTELLLYVMTRSNFFLLAEDHPKIWGKLIFKIACLMSNRLRLTNQALAEHLAPVSHVEKRWTPTKI